MKEKRMKRCLEICFTMGMGLVTFIMCDLRFGWLPEFQSGLLGGIGIKLVLGVGTLKHIQ